MTITLDEAIRHALDGNAVLFLGAGFPRTCRGVGGADLKDAGTLARSLAAKCGIESTAQNVPLDEVSDLYLEKHGSAALISLLRALYQVKRLGPEQAIYGSIPWRRVYTTNYDNAFELACTENGRVVVPLTSNAPVGKLFSKDLQCVHINGYIDTLDEDALGDSFKLTTSSYSASAFQESPWASQLRHDMTAAKAVFFVGYSTYDLDIKRLLTATEHIRARTLFVLGKEPGELLRHKVSRFGQVVDEDAASLASQISTLSKNHIPRAEAEIEGHCVQPIRAPESDATPADRDIFDLLLYGNVRRDALWTSTSSGDFRYICNRDAAAQVLQRLEDGHEDVVVTSDLANGKSLLLEEIAASGQQLGYSAYIYSTRGPEAPTEIERVARSDAKTLLCVDDYTDKRDDLEVFFRNRSPNTYVVYAARSLRHDVSFEWLYDRLGPRAVWELRVDELTERDAVECSALLESYGMWGHLAHMGPTAQARHIRYKCKGQMSGVLLDILDSPQVAHRLASLVSGISRGQEKYVVAAASILALSILGISTTSSVVSSLIDVDILNSPRFRKNESIAQIFDFATGEVRIRNSLVAEHILRSAVSPEHSVRALQGMIQRAENLRASAMYYSIFRDLMRFRSIQRLLPEKGKMKAAVSFYERLKNLGGCKRNPMFWLQYGIARMALKHYTEARSMLDTAFALAKGRERFDTYMLDNTLARLELLEKIEAPAPDLSSAMGSFRVARKIVNRQAGDHEQRHYGFRVAALYKPFMDAHAGLLDEPSKREIRSAAENIYRLLERMPSERAHGRHYAECREAMEDILGAEHKEPPNRPLHIDGASPRK